jgi:hypothetical protein
MLFFWALANAASAGMNLYFYNQDHHCLSLVVAFINIAAALFCLGVELPK